MIRCVVSELQSAESRSLARISRTRVGAGRLVGLLLLLAVGVMLGTYGGSVQAGLVPDGCEQGQNIVTVNGDNQLVSAVQLADTFSPVGCVEVDGGPYFDPGLLHNISDVIVYGKQGYPTSTIDGDVSCAPCDGITVTRLRITNGTLNIAGGSGHRLTSLGVENAVNDGIQIDSATDVRLVSITVTGAGGVGIDLHRCDSCDILGAMVTDNGQSGVLIATDSDDIDVRGSTFSRNHGNGLYFNGASNVIATGLTIDHNGVNGIELVSTDGYDVSGNTITDSGQTPPGGSGIRTFLSNNGMISGNTSNRNQSQGVDIDSSDNIEVSNNQTHYNSDGGIGVSDLSSRCFGPGDDSETCGNVDKSFCESGRFRGSILSNNVRVLNNVSTHNRSTGIGVDGAGALQIAGNTVTDNGAQPGNGTGRTTGWIAGNGNMGIYVAWARDVQVDNNTAQRNGCVDIAIMTCINVGVSGNQYANILYFNITGTQNLQMDPNVIDPSMNTHINCISCAKCNMPELICGQFSSPTGQPYLAPLRRSKPNASQLCTTCNFSPTASGGPPNPRCDTCDNGAVPAP